MAILKLQGVVLRSGTFVLEANLTAGPGVTVVFGPSGCGKTTLLRLVAGLQKPAVGQVWMDDVLWDDAAVHHHTPVQRRGVGYVPQEGLVFPHLTVAENVAFGLKDWARDARQQRVQELLDLLGLSGLGDRRALALSGGQRQRVALGRALAPHPRVLLLDEPLSALDRPEQRRLQRELQQLLPGLDIPCLWVTHNRHEAHLLGQRAVVMGEGRVLQQGSMLEVFERPAHASVARLFGFANVLEGRLEQGLLHLGRGRLPLGDRGLAEGRVRVFLRGEDVRLVPGSPETFSGWQATVLDVEDEGALLRIHLEAGLPLEARLTRAEADPWLVGPGQTVAIHVASERLHVLPL